MSSTSHTTFRSSIPAALLAALLLLGVAACGRSGVTQAARAGRDQPSGPSLIINGTLDTAHGYIGLVAFFDETGAYAWSCSGSLVSPTVLVTAAHCTDDPITPPRTARLYLDAQVDLEDYPYQGGHAGLPIANTLFPWECPEVAACPDTHDVAVVLLDEPVFLPEYARLPKVGELERIVDGPRYTGRKHAGSKRLPVAGYGLEAYVPEPVFLARRMIVDVTVSMDASEGGDPFGFNALVGAGACYGDSGGPLLKDRTSNVILAVVSMAAHEPYDCTEEAKYLYYRLDTAESLAYVEQFTGRPGFGGGP